MASKTPLVLSIIKRAAVTAGGMSVDAPNSGNLAPAAHTTTPAPGPNQIPPATAQHTATTAMPSIATDKQPAVTSVPSRGPQNPAIAAAGQAKAPSSGTTIGKTRGNAGGGVASTLNAQAGRFGKTAAAVLPTRQPLTGGEQQQPSVDDTVRKKMQYKWRDKMQKIDHGVSKLELQRQQAQAEMQLEQQQLQQAEELKAEQKAFDEKMKAQKQQQQISAAMPQFPLGQPDQGGAVQQQQPGLAKMAALSFILHLRTPAT